MKNICVIIPAYNESQTIGAVLEQLSAFPYSVVVVDDGSQDDTWQIVRNYPVHILRHITNLGQGAALRTGMEYALRFPEVECLVTFDADGQHSVENIAALANAILNQKLDAALGSRFCEGGTALNIRPLRRYSLRAGLWFTKLGTGLNITDTHNGMRAFSPAAARQLQLTQNRMAHASEILNKIAKLRFQYCEVPVDVVYTSYSIAKGQTFLSGIDILFDILRGRF